VDRQLVGVYGWNENQQRMVAAVISAKVRQKGIRVRERW
jgi:hypothetical protein